MTGHRLQPRAARTRLPRGAGPGVHVHRDGEHRVRWHKRRQLLRQRAVHRPTAATTSTAAPPVRLGTTSHSKSSTNPGPRPARRANSGSRPGRWRCPLSGMFSRSTPCPAHERRPWPDHPPRAPATSARTGGRCPARSSWYRAGDQQGNSAVNGTRRSIATATRRRPGHRTAGAVADPRQVPRRRISVPRTGPRCSSRAVTAARTGTWQANGVNVARTRASARPTAPVAGLEVQQHHQPALVIAGQAYHRQLSLIRKLACFSLETTHIEKYCDPPP